MTENPNITPPPVFDGVRGYGAPLAVYKGKTNAWFWIGAGLFGLGGLGALLSAGLVVWNKYGIYHYSIIVREVAIWGAVALASFGLALAILWGYFRNRKLALAVYEKGFAHASTKGVKSWAWEDVETITAAVTRHYTNGVYTGTTHLYTLVSRGSEKIVLTDTLQQVEAAYNELENRSFALRYQRAADRYNSGQAVQFGAVTISKDGGLQIGKKTYAWNEIEEVKMDKGLLSVKKKDGGWFSGAGTTAAATPNLLVLLNILDQTIGLKSGK